MEVIWIFIKYLQLVDLGQTKQALVKILRGIDLARVVRKDDDLFSLFIYIYIYICVCVCVCVCVCGWVCDTKKLNLHISINIFMF